MVSAEEDLAQVLSDVQDLGMRVTIVHVTVDGNWTISRSLRQECDDIMELTSAHLRPYIELIPGAEPARADEQYAAGALALRSASNGHSNGSTGSYQALPPGAGHAGPPSIYTAPVVAEYQRPALPLVFGRPETAATPGMPERGEPAHPESSRPEPVRGGGGLRAVTCRRAGPTAAGMSPVWRRCPPRRRTATRARQRRPRGRTCTARRSPCPSAAARRDSR